MVSYTARTTLADLANLVLHKLMSRICLHKWNFSLQQTWKNSYICNQFHLLQHCIQKEWENAHFLHSVNIPRNITDAWKDRCTWPRLTKIASFRHASRRRAKPPLEGCIIKLVEMKLCTGQIDRKWLFQPLASKLHSRRDKYIT